MSNLTFKPEIKDIVIDQEFFEHLLYEGDIKNAHSWKAKQAAQLVFDAFCASTDTPEDYRIAFARELAELLKKHESWVMEDFNRINQNLQEMQNLTCGCGKEFSSTSAVCPECFEREVNRAAIGVREQRNGLLNAAEFVMREVNPANSHSLVSNVTLKALASQISACRK
mgnify:CR=1 FL=1